MSETSGDQPEGHPAGQETYTWEHSARMQQGQMRRQAAEWASFLIPHLRPGMSLLDCGCGPGGITSGLADVVKPGPVVGVDVDPGSIEQARAVAAERGVTNARFQIGSIYELPFPDASFDAASAFSTLEHIGDPLKAMKEMRRVLKPGGVIGVRDPDWTTSLFAPPSPLLEEVMRLVIRVREHNGTSPGYARHQRRLLLEAGFARAEALAIAEYWGTLEKTRSRVGGAFPFVFYSTNLGKVAVEQGWTSWARVDEMMAEARAWAERPDALHVLLHFAAIGWVGES